MPRSALRVRSANSMRINTMRRTTKKKFPNVENTFSMNLVVYATILLGLKTSSLRISLISTPRAARLSSPVR